MKGWFHDLFEDQQVELYNLRKDIEEKNNISKNFLEITKELQTILDNWRKSLEAKIPKQNPDYIS